MNQAWYRKVNSRLTAVLQVSSLCTKAQNFSGVRQDRPYSDTSVNLCRKYSYELDAPGIESRWGEIFPPYRPALGSTQPPIQWVPGLSLG